MDLFYRAPTRIESPKHHFLANKGEPFCIFYSLLQLVMDFS